MTTQAPYFDTFNPANNHKTVLFAAGRPVQARELNEAQSILRDQIGKFADHVFKNGSRVSNGAVSILTYEYVRLKDFDPTGEKVIYDFFKEGVKLVGETSEVQAKLVAYTEKDSLDPATLYVVYTAYGKDAVQNRFLNGENVLLKDVNDNTIYTVTVRCPSCPDSKDGVDEVAPCAKKAQFVNVADGVYYYNGFFVSVAGAKIPFSKYGETVTCKVGFDVVERIITADDDVNLYDNSLGYPNEGSQGADRIVIDFTLSKRTNNKSDGTEFVELVVVEDGYIQVIKSDFQYADLMDTMAKRTYEESGNYTVVPFNVRYREHKKANANDNVGFKIDGDESLLQAVISTGIGYVKGYRTETLYESTVNVPKARTTKKIQNGSAYFTERAYMDLVSDDGMSVWANNPSLNLLSMERIHFMDEAPLNHAPAGKSIGSAIVTDIVYIGKNKEQKPIYRYFLTNIVMNGGSAKVKAVSNETARFLAVPHGDFAIQNPTAQNLFFDIGLANVKSLRDGDNATRGSTNITVRTKLNATLDTNGSYTFTINNGVFDSNIKDTIIIVGKSGTYETITATSDNCKPNGASLMIELGTGQSGKNVYVIQSVTRVDVLEKTKQSATNIMTNLSRASTNNFKAVIRLGKVDVYKIEYVRAYNNTTPSSYTDVTDKFVLDTGATYYQYGESTIKMKDGESIENNLDMIEVKVRYFEHSDTANAGFFTIDSYSQVLNDDESGITYANLPTVTGYDGTVYPIDRILDFRPVVLQGVETNTTIPAIKETAIFDVEYYVPRKDYLVLDKSGKFYHIQGIPSDNPQLPTGLTDDTMTLYEVFIPAYTYSYKDVKIKRIENKRYTMRDIGRLEQRIANLEYYTTLSALESQAASATVKDANGFDRYKNGFMVDDFSKHETGQTNNPEYRATIDKERKELRPTYSMASRKATLNESASKNFVLKAGVAMLPFDEVIGDEQPFATRPLSINPYLIFRKQGQLVLSPNTDTWADVERAPELVVDIDTGIDALQALVNRQNNIVTSFNNWFFANNTIGENSTQSSGLGTRTNQTSRVSTTNTSQSVTGRVGTIQGQTTTTRTSTTTTTTSTDTRTETQASIESRTTTYNYDAVTDVRVIPYMRETQIEFVATGLMPNTRYYVYFDDVNVSDVTSVIGSTEKVKVALQQGILLSNDKGLLAGVINIQAGKFFTGTKEVRITNDVTNSQDEDLETSFATAQFFSGGLNTQRQALTMNVISAVYDERDVVRTSTQSSSTTTTNTTSVTTGRVIPQPRVTRPSVQRSRDPIAQSFKFDYDCFVSALSVYFESLEANAEIWLEIREMDNGYPTETVLGRKVVNTSTLKSSFDASVATKIDFPVPVRVQAGREYCFVIGGESPSTRVWIAKLGETAINVPNKVVDTQVTLGTSFRSQNSSTWNAEQYEDIMYHLHICYFTAKSLDLQFNVNGGEEYVELDSVPFESKQNSNLVRVYTKNPHALIAGDKVKIALYPEFEYHATLTNGNLAVGHELRIGNGKATGIVKSVEYITPTSCIVKFALLDGAITANDNFVASPYLRKVSNKSVLKAYLDIDVEDYDIKQAAGKFTNATNVSTLNGIPLGLLNAQYLVKRVDDNHTFIIEVEQQADKTGRFGASGSKAIVNIKADLVNLSGARVLHDATEKWTIDAVTHGEQHSLFENENYVTIPTKELQLGADRYLDRPLKMASTINEKEKLAGRASVIVKATLETDNVYLSPQVNIDTFSLVLVSNNVSWSDEETMNREPNGSGRFKSETEVNGGSELFAYVTKTGVLKNAASDLRIWLDAFKPAHSDIEIYVKLRKSTDVDIDNLNWIKVTGYDNSMTSANPDNLLETDILLSDIMPELTGLDNLFSEFKVKLVGRSKNSAIPPLIKNLRVIAYT